jgi:D-aspartate ligase
MNQTVTAKQARRRGAIILGGAHGSLAIARSLGRLNVPVWLITADNRLAGLSRYVERQFHWPGPGDGGALEFLTALSRRYHLEGWVLFVGSDDELRFVALNHSALAGIFTLTTPGWDTVQWTADKARMNARADELDIARPFTLYPQSRDDLATRSIRFPVILKPRMRAGRNEFVDAKAWRIDDEVALLARYDQATALVGADNVMIQELIPGDGRAQFSYAAVWDRGKPVASLTARRRRQYPIDFGFTSTFVETVAAPKIEADSCRFLGSLDFSGPVEVEFKYDARDGGYKILDVNARAWTWIALGAKAGIDFAALQWRLAVGEAVVPGPARHGARWRYLWRDVAAAMQEMRAGRLSPLTYARSFQRPAAAAVFAWDDPWPALLDLPLSAVRVAARRFSRRHRTAAPPLQSARLRT